MSVILYVEGGGEHNKALQTICRRGFSEFVSKAGFTGRMPRIVACGGRSQAYESFRTHHEATGRDGRAILPVDSEARVVEQNPWEHVRLLSGDGWDRPNKASEDQIHFMIEVMEAWFHADKETLGEYYGPNFRANSLSQRRDVESIPKAEVIEGLRRATVTCQKGVYSKGEHSFRILARNDPTKVRAAEKYADRFLTVLSHIS